MLAGLIASLALCALLWDGLYFRTGMFRSSFPEGFLPLLLLPAALALALGVESSRESWSPRWASFGWGFWR